MEIKGESANESNHHGRILEPLSLLGEREVSGHDGAARLATVRNRLKQQLRIMAAEAEIAQLVLGEWAGGRFIERGWRDGLVELGEAKPIHGLLVGKACNLELPLELILLSGLALNFRELQQHDH